ncbi:MAG: hypothetical protein HZA52_00545 [Planctomycetes bacterium]|nr:hypothetical protein [Planctomycetota bacterium]
MNHYHIWCNLKQSHDDLRFASAVREYLDGLRGSGGLANWSLTRRKLGFGHPELGEFHLVLDFPTLADLDRAFGEVATRDGEVEKLHARVYSLVCDFRAALYRDFPDAERAARATETLHGA